MHELSIALSIVEGAEEELQRQGGGRVSAVFLKLGPLSGVVREALQFSCDLACEGTSLEGSSLVIEEMPIRIHCETCGGEGDPVSGQCLHCARCGDSRCRVMTGDELDFMALEIAA
jgi:hydrogenase nickel incorporation protein HypA/HybF